jgi:hypothetical protein
MWTEVLSGVGFTLGMGVFYGGMYKLGWECSKRDQIKKLDEMIRILDGSNQELIDKYEEHIKNLKSHKIIKTDELSEKLK